MWRVSIISNLYDFCAALLLPLLEDNIIDGYHMKSFMQIIVNERRFGPKMKSLELNKGLLQ